MPERIDPASDAALPALLSAASCPPPSLMAAAHPEPSALLQGVRWVCVLGFLLAATFPGLQALLNTFGGLCAALFLHHVLLVRTPLLPSRAVRVALIVFLLTALLFVLYPPLVRGAYPLKVTIGTFWHTVRGVAAAGVLLTVVQTSRALGYALLLYPFCLLLTIFWMHANRFIWGLGHYEDLGNSNILGMRIYLAVVGGMAVLLLPPLRRACLQRWMVCSGYAFAAICPIFFLCAFPLGRSDTGHVFPESILVGWYAVPMGLGVLASIRMLCKPAARGGWIFYAAALPVPMLLFAFSILTPDSFLVQQTAVLLMCAGVGVWWLLSRCGWTRPMGLVVFFLYGFFFLFEIGSRQAVLMVPVAFILVLAAWKWGLRRGVLPFVLAGVVVAGAWAWMGFPGIPDDAHWRQDSRQIVWMHSLRLGREHIWIGHGYGFRAFQAAWEGTHPEMPPWLEGRADPELLAFRPMHAHNVLVQIFVERGVFGLLCVLGLWATVLCALASRAGAKGGGTARDEGGLHARIAFVFFLLLPLQQMVDYTLQGTAESFFWLFFALLMAYGVYPRNRRDNPGSEDGAGGALRGTVSAAAPPNAEAAADASQQTTMSLHAHPAGGATPKPPVPMGGEVGRQTRMAPRGAAHGGAAPQVGG